DRLWHIPFNQQETVNEQLVAGREEIFFGAECSASAGKNNRPDQAVRYYIEAVSNPESLHGSFQLYRAFGATAAQNAERRARGLPMPVLAIGGAESSGEMVAETRRLTASDVSSVIMPNGHWLAEQAPDEMLAALGEFLAPYRDATGAT